MTSGVVLGLLVVAIAGLALAVQYALGRLYARWLSRPRGTDIPFIKARLEERGRRVLDIQCCGFHDGGRWDNSFREYRALVHDPLTGADQVRSVGVWANLLGFQALFVLDRKGRRRR